ncbi:kinesin-domain-containing protein, partial [Rozella allomycis CSF55]
MTDDSHIRVCIRVRPLNDRERTQEQTNAWQIEQNSLIQKRSSVFGDASGRVNSFQFDRVFSLDEDTERVYREGVWHIIQSSLEGVNGTVFAYGQTASGKTFTMQGTESCPGVIPLAVKHIFDFINASPSREYLLRVSFLEIYNEIIYDLLKPTNSNLKIHENVNKEIFVGNLSEEIVLTSEDVLKFLKKGEENRKVGETEMNERSSRSHTIFRMVIESRDCNDLSGAVRVSCLNLVDLAGSERASHTGAEGWRLKEGGHINRSLLALTGVIQRLSEKNAHVPYRDSKLTRILQPSLGGNAKTAIICTITPASGYLEETMSTLKFAMRAKSVENTPEVNEVISDEALLKRYKTEISNLRQQLEQKENEKVNENIRRELEKKEEEKKELLDKIDKLKAMILNANKVENVRVKRRLTWFPGVQVKKVKEEEEVDRGDKGMMEELTEQLKVEQEKKREMKKELERLKQDKQNNQDEIEEEKGFLEIQKLANEMEISELKIENSEIKKEILKFKNEISEKKNEISEIKKSLIKIKDDFINTKNNEKIIFKQLKDQQEFLNLENNSISVSFKEKERELKELRKVKERELKEEREKNEELNFTIKEYERIYLEKREQIQSQFDEFNLKLKEKDSEIVLLKEESEKEKVEIERLKGDMLKLKEESDRENVEIERLKGEIIKLKEESEREIVEKNKVIEEKDIEITRIKEESEKEKVANKRVIEEKDNENISLKEALEREIVEKER